MPPELSDLQRLLGAGLSYHRRGSLADAERIYRQVLHNDPANASALHLLGFLAHQVGRNDVAVELITNAINLDDRIPAFHNSLGNALKALGNLESAAAAYRKALVLQPELAEAHNNLAGTLAEQGALDEAIASFERAIAINPKLARTHNSLGAAFLAQHRLDEAAASYERALLCQPDFAEAHSNLGDALFEQGRLHSAVAAYRRATTYNPGLVSTHVNLGMALAQQGQWEEAVASYRHALGLKPDLAEAHNSLALALWAQGKPEEALASFQRAVMHNPTFSVAACNLSLLFNAYGQPAEAIKVITRSLKDKEDGDTKRTFVICAQQMCWNKQSADLRTLMVRALAETWGRPGDLAHSAIDFFLTNVEARLCVEQATANWPKRLSARDLFGLPHFSKITLDPLLHELLISTPICDMRLERFFTNVRYTMLEMATDGPLTEFELESSLNFFSALSRQCFINEYLYCHFDREYETALALRNVLADKLIAKEPPSPLLLVTVAAYFPLSSVPFAARLLETKWAAPVKAIIIQQVIEPEQDARERQNILRLTDIVDPISIDVSLQYEQNPYPRWVKLPLGAKPKNLIDHLLNRFRSANPYPYECHGRTVRMLSVGCGTGQHVLETALEFPSTEILAIDLSMSSLAYARRKMSELSNISIKFAHADILELVEIQPPSSFDVIDALGVLHHLKDPWTIWKKLLVMLSDGGFMHLALYSKIGRLQIQILRHLISQNSYTATESDIRRARQMLQESCSCSDMKSILGSMDFYSLSMCRDLLFHVQEQSLTLGDIETFVRENNLTFLGFDVGLDVLLSYRRRFPDDPASSNLAQWQTFELENPDSFKEMYNFWIQKPRARERQE